MGKFVELNSDRRINRRVAMPMDIRPDGGVPVDILATSAVLEDCPAPSTSTRGSCSGAHQDFICVNGCQRCRLSSAIRRSVCHAEIMERLTPGARQHFLLWCRRWPKFFSISSWLCFPAPSWPRQFTGCSTRSGFPVLPLPQPGDAESTAFVLLVPLLWLAWEFAESSEFGLEQNPRAARGFCRGLVPRPDAGNRSGAVYLMLDVYRIRDELVPWRCCGSPRLRRFVAMIEEFLFRGVLLGLAVEGLRSAPAAVWRFRDFCGGAFFGRASGRYGVEWWTGLAQIMRIFEAGPPPSLWIAGFLMPSLPAG